MPLDSDVRELLDRMAAFEEGSGPPPDDEHEAVLQAREGFDQQAQELFGAAEGVGAINDLEALGPGGPVPVRVYTPAIELPPDAPPRGAVLFVHGGGWLEGSLESHDGLCRALCNGSDAVVVAVGYRLAPEHPFPAAVEDCCAALAWLHTNAASLDVDPERLAAVGDSAGANLVAVAGRRAHQDGGPELRLQVLAYPALDAAMDTDSYRDLAADYGLTREAMERSWRMYADGHDPTDPELSPLRAEDLSGAPPSLIIACEYDPLRDEGERYGERLREAGVQARVIRYPGVAHGFLRWRGSVKAAGRALDEICDALRMALDESDDAVRSGAA